MSLKDARRVITDLKKAIRANYPNTILRVGPRPYGDAKDVFLYAYAAEDKMDAIIEMASSRVTDILLKTGVYVHIIPLRPGTMTWLWDDGKKQARRAPRARPRIVAESRAKYKTRKPTARRKAARAA